MATEATDQEVFGHVAAYVNQAANLARALETLIEVEKQEPLEGDQIGALSKAILRASEDISSLFEAYYHPSQATL
ncbi:MAG: hypothetical protein AAF340_02845 [Pseudomonadota bacterium]